MNDATDTYLDNAAARCDQRANTLRRDARILEARADELEDMARQFRLEAATYRLNHDTDDEPTIEQPAAGDPSDEPTIVMEPIRP